MLCRLLGEEPIAEFVEAAAQAVADNRYLQVVSILKCLMSFFMRMCVCAGGDLILAIMTCHFDGL